MYGRRRAGSTRGCRPGRCGDGRAGAAAV